MKRSFFTMIAILTLVVGLAPTSVIAAPTVNGNLEPGVTVTYEQNVPINIIFIGYDTEQINQQAVLNQLPTSYEPVVRYPRFYGLTGREMGLKFNFDYNVTFAENSFADKFFNYLEDIGTPGDPTDFQLLYNDQKKNVLEVTGPVLYVDAPSVEGWLASNLNVDENSYTVVFVNWYSRDDFMFHVYTKTDEPDPDTGYNFGELRPSRKMIAWGGTNSRLWFYDLSAGPEAWTDNWNVDNRDLDGNRVEDYRMPPIWEYKAGGYRKPAALSSDLGLVTRWVGINLLFTTSPLYDPLVTAPDVKGRKIVHTNMFEDDPASLGTDWIDTDFVQSEFSSFEPYYSWQTDLVDRNPIDAEAQRALRIFAEVLVEDSCWNSFGTPFAELFCYFDANLGRYVPEYKEADYVLPIFAFNTTAANLGSWFGLLGFADDNWIDGTQTYVFEFDAAEYRDLGYGFSTTTVHEGGHHIGMSHPHDGYDSALGIDYGPEDDFYFAWSGDESDTVMSYISLSSSFSTFDMDNMYRYEFAGYLNGANHLLDDILAHPNAKKVQSNITSAQGHAENAIENFNEWNYLAAATNARLAYEEIVKAADQLGITTPADNALRVAPNLSAPHEGDPIRFPDN